MGFRLKPHCSVSGRALFFVALVVSLAILVSFTFLYSGPCGLLSEEPCLFGIVPKPAHQGQERIYTDAEVAALSVAKDILSRNWQERSQVSKIAFMFMTPGRLPFESIWNEFFKGHEELFSVYVHASDLTRFESNSSYFKGREIPSKKVAMVCKSIKPRHIYKVFWGRIEMVDAERRLFAHALLDPANMFFILLSESCIPLFDFKYIYQYVMSGQSSFVDSFNDPGPQGQGRYLDQMKPEIRREDWRKGAQWITVHRKHALLIALDHLYYNKFRKFCKPSVNEESHDCVPDEHYIPTFLHIVDPAGVVNRSLTFADWSEGNWHPRSFGESDVTPFGMMELQVVDTIVRKTSEGTEVVIKEPCIWNGKQHNCYLFARKFKPDAVDALQQVLSSITSTTAWSE